MEVAAGNVRDCRSGTKQWKDSNEIFAHGVRQTSTVVWTVLCLKVSCANSRNMQRERSVRRRQQALSVLLLKGSMLGRAVLLGVLLQVGCVMLLELHRGKALCLVVVLLKPRGDLSTVSSNLPLRSMQVIQALLLWLARLVTVVQLQRTLCLL